MANAVTGSTPEWVISRTASGHFRTSSSTRRFSSTMSASSPSSASSNRWRLSAAYLMRANFSNSAPRLRPQLPLFLHPVHQRHGLQLVLGTGPPLHLLVPIHQQLPHIAHLQARHPDPGKPILEQQLHSVLRVSPVGF